MPETSPRETLEGVRGCEPFMKLRTLLAATSAVAIFAANSPAAEQPAKKSKTPAKPAAPAKEEAPKADKTAPAQPQLQPRPRESLSW
jgi:hypothetical protein